MNKTKKERLAQALRENIKRRVEASVKKKKAPVKNESQDQANKNSEN